MAIDVDQDEAGQPRCAGPVEEEAGAYAGLKMIVREVGAVELKEPPRRAAPSEAVRNTVHEHVVNREHEGRVYRVRSCDRGLVRRSPSPSREFLGHGRRYATAGGRKKSAENGAL